MTELFFEARQNSNIAGAKADAASARSQAENLALRVTSLEKRADRMGLVCQALWEILRERTNLTDEDVYARMQEIDMRDGVADGRIHHAVSECPNCHRPRSRKHANCMYCGAALARENLVD